VAAWLGAGGAVVVDAVVMLLGGAAGMLRRPEIAWLDAPPYRRPESRRPILRAIALERELALADRSDPVL
jgi:hypothetical protein